MQEYVMLGLRKIEGIDIQEFKNRFDVDFLQYLKKNIINFVEKVYF